MFKINRQSPIKRIVKPALSRTFTETEIASMVGLGTTIEVPAGSDLMVEGTDGTHVFFICEGSATVRRGDEVLAMVGAGDVVGERALITGQPRNATVTALEAITALQFDQTQFNWLRLESRKVKALSNELVEARS